MFQNELKKSICSSQLNPVNIHILNASDNSSKELKPVKANIDTTKDMNYHISVQIAGLSLSRKGATAAMQAQTGKQHLRYYQACP